MTSFWLRVWWYPHPMLCSHGQIVGLVFKMGLLKCANGTRHIKQSLDSNISALDCYQECDHKSACAKSCQNKIYIFLRLENKEILYFLFCPYFNIPVCMSKYLVNRSSESSIDCINSCWLEISLWINVFSKLRFLGHSSLPFDLFIRLPLLDHCSYSCITLHL